MRPHPGVAPRPSAAGKSAGSTCEAVGLEHLDATRYTAATDAGVSTLDAVNAIEITLRPRGKRR